MPIKAPTTDGKPAGTSPSRRHFLGQAAAGIGLVAASTFAPTRFAIGARAPVRVGILLPYTGVYAKLGQNITDGMMMRLAEAGNKLGGRDIEYVRVDSEASPPKAVDNTNKLVRGEKVDFIVGPVHSGVAMAMTKVMKKAPKTIMVVPNAGADQLTGSACASNIFRSSFSNWQTGYPMGAELVKRGHKRIVTMSWNYGAGKQIVGGFVDGFKAAGGGDPIEQIWIEFGNVEFQAHLTKIASLNPDAVYVFFAGGGAVKYVKDYDAAIDRKKIPLYGVGFLTEGTTEAQGAAAEGIVTAMHWADTLDTPTNLAFMSNFKKATGNNADVYAVQGYDAASLILQAMAAVGGDTSATKDIITAMETTRWVDSPRGVWHMSKNHNPVQDFYLRRVQGGKNVIIGMAHKALEDPGRGCKL